MSGSNGSNGWLHALSLGDYTTREHNLRFSGYQNQTIYLGLDSRVRGNDEPRDYSSKMD